jgi:hypothetical protein
MIER